MLENFWKQVSWSILVLLDKDEIAGYAEKHLDMIKTKDAHEFVQDHAPDPGDRL